MSADDMQFTQVDGRDALAMVLLRPSQDNPGHVVAEANASGMPKRDAAHYLRVIADMWDPPA